MNFNLFVFSFFVLISILFIQCNAFIPISSSSSSSSPSSSSSSTSSVTLVSVNATNTSSFVISPLLWGAFLEDINHAVVGGLSSELVNGRNFASGTLWPWSPIDSGSSPLSPGPINFRIVKDKPISYENIHSMEITFNNNTPSAASGVFNTGYWGMNIIAGQSYTFNIDVWASLEMSYALMVVSLQSATGAVTYDTKEYILQAYNGTGSEVGWMHYTDLFTSNGTDPNARLSISFPYADSTMQVNLFYPSLVPYQTYSLNTQLPIRNDLALAINDMAPAFMRFPGGTYIEGGDSTQSYHWKDTIGSYINRSGHENYWGYWSEDSIGFLEYLTWIESLSGTNPGESTLPIWVVNAGLTRTDVAPSYDAYGWLQDAFDSLEYAMGDAVTTKWGALRAQHGHPQPFNIPYVAIGNEDCSQDYYDDDYIYLYTNLKRQWPNITFIANCDMHGVWNSSIPVDIFDYHVYNSADYFYANEHLFDSWNRSNSSKVFCSEYAVVNGGHGNLEAAMGEAVWMNGMERNSDLVLLASYAPLLVNTNDLRWYPDAIWFDASRWYGSVTYFTQVMYSNAQYGIDRSTHRLLSHVVTSTTANFSVSVSMANSINSSSSSSTTSNNNQWPANFLFPEPSSYEQVIIVKMVNYQSLQNTIQFELLNIKISDEYNLITLSYPEPLAVNTFDKPQLIYPAAQQLKVESTSPKFLLPAYSIAIARFYV